MMGFRGEIGTEARNSRRRRAEEILQQELVTPIEEFNTLLNDFEIKISELSSKTSYSYLNAAVIARQFHTELLQAKNAFSNNMITIDSLHNFINDCASAVTRARPVLDTARGWYEFHIFFRAILGVLAAITVIPAIITEIASKDGFVMTFFGKSTEIKTDSSKKIDAIAECVNSFPRVQVNQDNIIIAYESERRSGFTTLA